jgi:hypothetical protein
MNLRQLMGISSRTYVGFKLTEKKQRTNTRSGKQRIRVPSGSIAGRIVGPSCPEVVPDSILDGGSYKCR